MRAGPQRRLIPETLTLWNCGTGDDCWESLGCKKMQPVHPKGDQPRIFMGRLMLKLQYLATCETADSLEKTLMLGKIEGRRRRGWQSMKWLNGIIDSVGMSLRKLWELVKGREVWSAAAEWLNSWFLTHICSLCLFIGPLLLDSKRKAWRWKEVWVLTFSFYRDAS